jgi:hypothetical protein
MKIVNERNARILASRLGITTKTLESGYQFIIVKDEMIKKIWKDREDDDLFYDIQNFLKVHPYYGEFLSRFGIDKYSKIRAALDVRQIAEVFQHTFDAWLSFNDKDRPEKTEGFFIRTEHESLVAIAASKWTDGCERSQSATVIHEYGHYAEQRIIPDDNYRPSQPYSDRETSFASALLLLLSLKLGTDSNKQKVITDELVAWVNSIWISWIVGLDPRTAILGAAIDSADPDTSLRPEVVKQIFGPLAIMACSKKHAAKHFNQFGSYDLSAMSKYSLSKMGDKSLCIQIDQSTKHIFDMIGVRKLG